MIAGVHRRRRVLDRLAWALSLAAVGTALLPLLSILGTVVANGLPVLLSPGFLTLPGPRSPGEPSGILNSFVGSLLISGLASLLAIPVGILAGVYLAEYAGPWGDVVRFSTQVLTGVPTIVAGTFVYGLWVLRFGFSALAGGFALAILMIPVVARATEEALRSVPLSTREAALALGAARWQTTLLITLATAKAGVVTGILLALARAMGEAAPLFLTAFGNQSMAQGPLDKSNSLPQLIFVYSTGAFPEWHAQAWGAALVLIALVLGINVVVRWLTRGRY